GQRVKVSVLTRGSWLALFALIGGVAAVALRWGPDGAEMEEASSRPPIGAAASSAERHTPGIREGAQGLGVGALVYCLGHRGLGVGTIVGVIGLRARVGFPWGELTLPRAQIQFVEPAAEAYAGSWPGEYPPGRLAPKPQMTLLGHAVICPSRPELGRGFL